MNRTFFSNLIPQQLLFGRFRLIKALSVHDAGAVYLCSDIKDNKKLVALKVIATEALANSVIGERFRNEIAVNGRLDHTHVLSGDHFFQDEVFTAFSMEYLSGGTLADLLFQEKRLDLKAAARLLLELCSGLEAIHKAGIIHRDLKPENVLLDYSGQAKIADFGIAVIGSSISGGDGDALLGTINYLPPEYIESGYFDIRSDLYCLGLIGYEMITGVVPVYGSSPLEQLTMRVKIDPTPALLCRHDCPAELSEILAKCLARDLDQRFQSAQEMKSRIYEIAELYENDETSTTRVSKTGKSKSHHQEPLTVQIDDQLERDLIH
jgi:eukaryotic-like serine/threonine-protein kinase